MQTIPFDVWVWKVNHLYRERCDQHNKANPSSIFKAVPVRIHGEHARHYYNRGLSPVEAMDEIQADKD